MGQKVIYAPKLATAINMFEAGVGIGYVPHHRIRQGLDDGRVLKKAIVEHKQPTQLFYAWHANQKDCCRISRDISFRFFGLAGKKRLQPSSNLTLVTFLRSLNSYCVVVNSALSSGEF
ncbi:type 2 periplasmic-binding domain-containing protein [Marinobacter psychrophilus]|uniref:hypothetical protein n=1 Tax=Marinobacter psychrophilus TaxID=330734 RepID=UPI00387329F0